MVRILAVGLALALFAAACAPHRPEPPALNARILQREISAIAERGAPGVLGVGLMDLQSGETWTFNGDRRFPMQSVFKAPLAAAVLAEASAGRLALDETVTLAEADLSPPHSPVAADWPARRAYTVEELLVRSVKTSDNTAADVLMARIGGPGAVTGWLRNKKVHGLRIDRYERQLQPESLGLSAFHPAWREPTAWRAAVASVPEERRRAALAAYLADPRDTATPREMLVFLARLDNGELLGRASTAWLRKILTETPSGPGRLKAGLPNGARLAHKTGTGATDQGVNAATNDVGVVTLADGRRYAVAVFLTGARASEAERDAILADVMRAIVRVID